MRLPSLCQIALWSSIFPILPGTARGQFGSTPPQEEYCRTYANGYGLGKEDGRYGVFDIAGSCGGDTGSEICAQGYKEGFVAVCVTGHYGCGDGPTEAAQPECGFPPATPPNQTPFCSDYTYGYAKGRETGARPEFDPAYWCQPDVGVGDVKACMEGYKLGYVSNCLHSDNGCGNGPTTAEPPKCGFAPATNIQGMTRYIEYVRKLS